MKISKLLFLIVGGFGLFLLGLFLYFSTRTSEQIINNPVVKKAIVERAGTKNEDIVNLLPQFLGFQETKTYLFLFANNTEIRPAGGFLGTYAAVRFTAGKMETLAIEGTEVLDRRTPETWKPEPPKILTEKLGVDRWYFRDSNWSPDYPSSVKKALEFYAAEGGAGASEIDGVITFTPTVLEKLLEITGPISIEGVEFTAKNVVRQLEHEVEFGYKDKGIDFENRKKIIDPFFHELLRKIGPDAIFHSQKYVALFEELAREKQVLVYFKDPNIQKIMQAKNWTGEVKNTSGDYLLWVDANLAALKTDEVMERTLTYSMVAEPKTNSFVVSAKMKYVHNGVFDKFTSRYRTYARVYAPLNSKLISVKSYDNGGKMVEIVNVDQGQELGKQWFGAFYSIEPQKTGTLEFTYILSPEIVSLVKQGKYSLLSQKQAGIERAALTLNLNFGTTIQSAVPAEDKKEWGDSVYTVNKKFDSDQQIEVKF
jgi:hypothetical protein